MNERLRRQVLTGTVVATVGAIGVAAGLSTWHYHGLHKGNPNVSETDGGPLRTDQPTQWTKRGDGTWKQSKPGADEQGGSWLDDDDDSSGGGETSDGPFSGLLAEGGDDPDIADALPYVIVVLAILGVVYVLSRRPRYAI